MAQLEVTAAEVFHGYGSHPQSKPPSPLFHINYLLLFHYIKVSTWGKPRIGLTEFSGSLKGPNSQVTDSDDLSKKIIQTHIKMFEISNCQFTLFSII